MTRPDTRFGSMVFGDSAMKERLPKNVYLQLCRTIRDGRSLDSEISDVVANAMKDWAVEHGATHFTHWFQPMTGITAEKHDSFITPFSGKELVKGEPDASSFPNGGLRSTFEARGYTAWDPTSYAFIKDRVLCIPTAFYSYSGEALDKKTPLLRSMETLSRQAVRILHLFGEEAEWVRPTIGAEQEYFLIDEDIFLKRKDLMMTGRTLFGAMASKGQELDDHYFGAIKPRVQAFMDELNDELWKLGILAKTEHNEVAPAQHELAPVYVTANAAIDQNQLTMEMMQKIARRHHMVCLLHEKPFDGVNGSGKHNNWSICDSYGNNLLEPGNTPLSNARFLLFFTAIIKAVDEYQDLLRLSVASAGNDHRLGANEAPPAIVSMFIGSELEAVLRSIETDLPYEYSEDTVPLRVGAHVLPKFPRDTTDRNRTSPFAFTGNKFEFRMPGSSASLSGPNIVLNTAVAEELRQFAVELEKAEDFDSALHSLIKRTIKEHKRIIFNGNGYEDSWIEEAGRRGLLNLKTTPEAVSHFTDPKNLALFSSHRVFSASEVSARCEIMFENYVKVLNIEALTMIEMARRDILPAVSRFSGELASSSLKKKQLLSSISAFYEETAVSELSLLADKTFQAVSSLEQALSDAKMQKEGKDEAFFFCSHVVPAMAELRETVDKMEVLTDSHRWPYPSYGDIIFSVK
ncbi:MAG: glutamine synthetase III [Clostridium sp.]|nr:glutamine synthetase III [Clostridium sp.]